MVDPLQSIPRAIDTPEEDEEEDEEDEEDEEEDGGGVLDTNTIFYPRTNLEQNYNSNPKTVDYIHNGWWNFIDNSWLYLIEFTLDNVSDLIRVYLNKLIRFDIGNLNKVSDLIGVFLIN